MPGEGTDLTSLAARKQLLLVESELNRAELQNEWLTVKSEIDRIGNQVRSAAGIASSVTRLGLSFANFFRPGTPARHDGKKPGWISTLFRGARAGVSLWSSLR
jgi:hypothetical protein